MTSENAKRTCSLCDAPYYGRGLCVYHYQRDPEVVKMRNSNYKKRQDVKRCKEPPKVVKKCRICAARHFSLGLCEYHYNRDPKVMEKRRERERKQRAQNLEKHREIDRIRDAKRRQKASRREYMKKYQKEYALTERGKELRKQQLERYAKKRAKQIILATPKWANLQQIKQIYANCPPGYDVDHVLPLNSKFVCGLHTPDNLQYLTHKENFAKGNKILPEFLRQYD